MKSVLILGAGGQLGSELCHVFPEAHKFYHSGRNREILDITNYSELDERIEKIRPTIIINAAALANVDECEKDRKLAYSVNGESVRNLVRIAKKVDTLFVHVSTDYVFDGSEGNYGEGSDPNPINYYGLSKLVGDIFALSYDNSIIVRTSGVYGYNRNFPLFVYEKLKVGEPITAIDGFYSPIHAKNLAKAIQKLIAMDFRGVINVAGDRISRYDLAMSIAREFNLPQTLISKTDTISTMNAKRPFDSSLDISLAKKILGFDFHSIESNLDAFKESTKN